MGILESILVIVILCLATYIGISNSDHNREIKELKKEMEKKDDKIFYAIKRLDEIKDELKESYSKLPEEIDKQISEQKSKLKIAIYKAYKEVREENRITIEMFLRTFDKDVVTEEDKKRLNVTYEEAIKYLNEIKTRK